MWKLVTEYTQSLWKPQQFNNTQWCNHRPIFKVTRRQRQHEGGSAETSAVQTKEHAVVCVCVREPTWLVAWLDANNPSPWRHSSGFVRALHRWLDWLEGTLWESKPNNQQQLRSNLRFSCHFLFVSSECGPRENMEAFAAAGFPKLGINSGCCCCWIVSELICWWRLTAVWTGAVIWF